LKRLHNASSQKRPWLLGRVDATATAEDTVVSAYINICCPSKLAEQSAAAADGMLASQLGEVKK